VYPTYLERLFRTVPLASQLVQPAGGEHGEEGGQVHGLQVEAGLRPHRADLPLEPQLAPQIQHRPALLLHQATVATTTTITSSLGSRFFLMDVVHGFVIRVRERYTT